MKTPEPLSTERLYELCLQAKTAAPGSMVEISREELWALVDAAKEMPESAEIVGSTEVLERLAALEHEQWAHWTDYFLAHSSPENVKRWARQAATPYDELSEAEKEADRKWARRVLVVL